MIGDQFGYPVRTYSITGEFFKKYPYCQVYKPVFSTMKIGNKHVKNASPQGAARQEPPPNGSPQWLLRAVQDEHLSGAVILDESGAILFVTKARQSLPGQRGLAPRDYGVGKNYLTVCPSILGERLREAAFVVAGVHRAMTGEQAEVCLDWADPGPAAQRWYRVRTTRFGTPDTDCGYRVMVVHEEIAPNKGVEEALREREELVSAVRTARAEREQAEEQLKKLSGRLINAQEEERRRIARELHDDLNQRLALLSIELEQYGQRRPRSVEEHHRRMREIWGRAREISADVHRLSHQLHPSKLDTLGLVAALKSLCHDLSQRKVLNPEFTHRQVPGLIPKDVALCLFRVVQEALSNAAKHSGAQAAKVALVGDAQGLYLRVSDAGAGFNVEKVRRGSGLGLVSMQERLRLVGGEFSIESAPGQGARISARVPLAAAGSSTPT